MCQQKIHCFSIIKISIKKKYLSKNATMFLVVKIHPVIASKNLSNIEQRYASWVTNKWWKPILTYFNYRQRVSSLVEDLLTDEASYVWNIVFYQKSKSTENVICVIPSLTCIMRNYYVSTFFVDFYQVQFPYKVYPWSTSVGYAL